jgi:secondary thiamine-phosphate synthase enzyme
MSIEVRTDERVDVVDVTDDVRDAVPDSLTRGLCTVFVSHTTAGVVVNENERRLRSDLSGLLESLAPEKAAYEHDAIDDNAAAHLRATLLGESVAVPVAEGELALGRWQSVLFVECDGPRTRSLEVVVTPAVRT